MSKETTSTEPCCELNDLSTRKPCQICGKPTCRNCRTHVEGKAVCPDCVSKVPPARQSRIPELGAKTAALSVLFLIVGAALRPLGGVSWIGWALLALGGMGLLLVVVGGPADVSSTAVRAGGGLMVLAGWIVYVVAVAVTPSCFLPPQGPHGSAGNFHLPALLAIGWFMGPTVLAYGLRIRKSWHGRVLGFVWLVTLASFPLTMLVYRLAIAV